MGWFKKTPPPAKVETVSFTVGPDMRTVDSAGVTAIDNALGRVGSGELLHMMDPRRINSFSSGGPSTWSIAFIPVGNDLYFITYGNSEQIDPARAGIGFELAIRIPANTGEMWAGMLLRQTVRYMLMSKRELKLSDYLPFPQMLTRVVPGVDAPPTAMNAIMLVNDPLVPFIETLRGRIEVRRVVGVHPDELEQMETWSVAGLATTLARWSPELTTDVLRPSLARDPAFTAAMAEGSRREGSQIGFVAVPGVTWKDDGTVITVQLPGGAQARRIHRMVEARLRHDRHLLVHDSDPQNQLAVALKPSPQPFIEIDGPVVVLGTTADSPLLAMLANPPDGPITWRLS